MIPTLEWKVASSVANSAIKNCGVMAGMWFAMILTWIVKVFERLKSTRRNISVYRRGSKLYTTRYTPTIYLLATSMFYWNYKLTFYTKSRFPDYKMEVSHKRSLYVKLSMYFLKKIKIIVYGDQDLLPLVTLCVLLVNPCKLCETKMPNDHPSLGCKQSRIFLNNFLQ